MIHANPQPRAEGQAEGKHADRPFAVEYYYTVKWGHTDEFIRLFKKNHYPLLKKHVGSRPRACPRLSHQTALSRRGGRPLGLPG